MAKKKEEKNELNIDEKLDAVLAKLKEHEQVHENFRASFQNLESKLRTLVERNRLR